MDRTPVLKRHEYQIAAIQACIFTTLNRRGCGRANIVDSASVRAIDNAFGKLTQHAKQRSY